MLRKKVAAALFLAALGLLQATWASARPPGPLSQSGTYRERVAIEALEDLYGRNIVTKAWRAAAARFPTYRACLISDRAKAATLTIDWYKIGSEIEANVCLSRIGSKIGDVSGMVVWLRTHGFTVNRVSKAHDGYAIPVAARVGTDIDASWSLKRNGPMTRRGVLAPLTQWAFGHGVGCGFFMSPRGKVVSVNCTTTIL